jgi:SAM-dependent methyltransferase
MESASPLNAQQIEYWNGAVGEKWARLQERIDLHMNAITDAVIPFAAPQPDERVLDIGCGCGTTTLLLAMKVGGEGAVAAVDISAPMLNVARARAQTQNANIAFVEADASVHDFQPVFDLVFSRFGVMFFADPTAAFTNIRRALAPRGRLAFVCWRSAKENLWASVPMTVAKDLLPPQEPADPCAPGPFAFAEKDRLAGILRGAGYHGIRIEPLDTTMNMGKTLDDAAEESLNIGPLARAAADVDAATRAEIFDAVKKAFEQFQSPAGITPPAACWFVGARG